MFLFPFYVPFKWPKQLEIIIVAPVIKSITFAAYLKNREKLARWKV